MIHSGCSVFTPKQYDVIIVGAGMGGIGAALYFSRNTKKRVLVVEKQHTIGGTAVIGGVNCFEPGVSDSLFLPEIVRRLGDRGRVQKTVYFPTASLHCAVSADDPGANYGDTLKRAGVSPEDQRRYMFDPLSMASVLEEMLACDHMDILTDCTLIDAETVNGRIRTVTVDAPSGRMTISAEYFLDCTGDIVLARMAGCSCFFGEEDKKLFDEPSAPERGQRRLNGVSYMFRVSQHCESDCLGDNGADAGDFDETKIYAQLNTYPDGDISVNMLPTMNGSEYFEKSEEDAERMCLKRVFLYWEYLKKNPVLSLEKKGYHLSYVFPLRGIRESYRLNGRYVLTQKDILTPADKHPLKHRFIAFADHPMDIHDGNTALVSLREPYGIPYECLLPREIDNLLVACRGLSASHIASSSCRLSRTMMRLGEAAAEACTEAMELGVGLKEVDILRITGQYRVI